MEPRRPEMRVSDDAASSATEHVQAVRGVRPDLIKRMLVLATAALGLAVVTILSSSSTGHAPRDQGATRAPVSETLAFAVLPGHSGAATPGSHADATSVDAGSDVSGERSPSATPAIPDTAVPSVARSDGGSTGAPADSSELATPPPAAPTATAAPNGAAMFPGTRDKRAWPFSSTSIWNMPIGSGAVYVPAKIGVTGAVSIDEEYLVFPSSSDPVVPVYTNEIWGRGRCERTMYEFNIHLPADFVVGDASRTSTPNAPAAILSTDGRTLRQMSPVARCEAGGPLTAGWLAPDQDIYGDGVLGGHGGSGLSGIGGSIRVGELINDVPIRHALKVNLWGRLWLSPEDGGYRWPAVTGDAGFDQSDNANVYAGSVPALRMGSLLALPPDVNIASLDLKTKAAKKIAWALQNYGAYVVDNTAGDSHALNVQAGVADEFSAAYGYDITAYDGPWYDDMMKISGALSVVDNNSPSSIGGGGTPRQPLAPPIGN